MIFAYPEKTVTDSLVKTTAGTTFFPTTPQHGTCEEPMPEHKSPMEYITGIFSLIPLILYTIVAILLTIIAIFSVYDSAVLIYQIIMGFSKMSPRGQSHNRHQLPAPHHHHHRPLRDCGGLFPDTPCRSQDTACCRASRVSSSHILVYNVATTNDVLALFAAIAVLAVLILGIVLIKPEPLG